MAILDYIGKDKESNFLLPEMQSYPSLHGKELCFFPQSASFPSFSPKYNTTLPHKSSLIYREGSSPFKVQNLYKSFPTKSFFFIYILIFHIIFYLSVFLFFFFINSFEFFLFFPKVGILPQSGKIISQRLG